MESPTAQSLREAFHRYEADPSLTPEKRATRDRILAAAAEEFARFGYRRASMDEIARSAAVAKGTLYLYFESKKDLVVAAIVREKMQMLPALIATLERPAGEQLEGYLRTAIRFMEQAPLTARLVRGDGELTAILNDLGQAMMEGQVQQGLAFMAPMVSAVNPRLTDERCLEVASLLGDLVRVLPTVEDHRALLGQDNTRTGEQLALLLVAGVRGLES